MSVFPMPDFGSRQELSDEELRGMRETVARALEVTAEIARREQRHPQGLISDGFLIRDGMDVATELMGIPPVSDEDPRGA
ncbi:hypothetical protein [Microtetraspora sp. NBRC 16547]|uniref:hypothetical protein n=1 Tax=Microtetraspora sp. NBRC 16547 TaxID=3030993 RepID=UPI0024A0925D|nr:hypothetical protein [Microtetraspora sp. NBRC 16547]GLW96996.1 hypothetical protein Misp02_10830 [Microtetraspora sp. NBRC 16547]